MGRLISSLLGLSWSPTILHFLWLLWSLSHQLQKNLRIYLWNLLWQCTRVFNDSSTSAWKWELKDFKCCQSQSENAFLWRPSAFELKHYCPRFQGLHYVCYSLDFGIHDDRLYCQGMIFRERSTNPSSSRAYQKRQ